MPTHQVYLGESGLLAVVMRQGGSRWVYTTGCRPRWTSGITLHLIRQCLHFGTITGPGFDETFSVTRVWLFGTRFE